MFPNFDLEFLITYRDTLKVRFFPDFLRSLILLSSVMMAPCASAAESVEKDIHQAFAGRDAVIVLIDCGSGETIAFPADKAEERLAPCSTFKIVNTLIGLETGILTSADQPFYKWDGVERSIPGWNKDLTLREAFQASCVPAFQQLARQIGAQRMKEWIDKIGYGNGDISAGIDVFWLPAKGRKTILISPSEQAELMRKLVTGGLPLDNESINVLREVMLLTTDEQGTLYGKTGSGTDDSGNFNLGWFVGFVESRGKSHAFAGVVYGENIMSKQAREIVEAVLKNRKLLNPMPFGN